MAGVNLLGFSSFRGLFGFGGAGLAVGALGFFGSDGFDWSLLVTRAFVAA